MISPKYFFLGLSGAGTIGLLACCVANPVTLSSIPMWTTEEGKKIQDQCGDYIWNWDGESDMNRVTNKKNEKQKSFIEWTVCQNGILLSSNDQKPNTKRGEECGEFVWRLRRDFQQKNSKKKNLLEWINCVRETKSQMSRNKSSQKQSTKKPTNFELRKQNQWR